MDDAGNNNVDVVFDDRLLLLLLLLILEGCAHCLIQRTGIGEWDGCGETPPSLALDFHLAALVQRRPTTYAVVSPADGSTCLTIPLPSLVSPQPLLLLLLLLSRVMLLNDDDAQECPRQ